MFISNMPSLSSNMAMEIHTNGSVTFRYVKFLTTRGYVNVYIYILYIWDISLYFSPQYGLHWTQSTLVNPCQPWLLAPSVRGKLSLALTLAFPAGSWATATAQPIFLWWGQIQKPLDCTRSEYPNGPWLCKKKWQTLCHLHRFTQFWKL